MSQKKMNKGFSLVELLVVITIMAILSVTAYVALGGQTVKAKNSRRQQDLSTIQSALEIYYIENSNKYPASIDNLVPKQLSKKPNDPASTEAVPVDYVYHTRSNNKEYQLGTTLETETAPYYKAYLIGNAIVDEMNGENPADSSACNPVTDGSTTCVPYLP